jgi:hypothetical protein
MEYPKYESVIKNLDSVRKKRNKFAHSKITTSKKIIDKLDLNDKTKINLECFHNGNFQNSSLDISKLDSEIELFQTIYKELLKLSEEYITSYQSSFV